MRHFFLIASLLVLAAGCGGDEAPEEVPSPIASPEPTPEPIIEEPLPSSIEGVEVIRLRKGTGDVSAEEPLEILLDLRITDDGEETWEGVFGFRLGTGQGSEVLEEGVANAVIGEERRIMVAPDYTEKRGMSRPEGTTRVYQFKVLHVGSIADY